MSVRARAAACGRAFFRLRAERARFVCAPYVAALLLLALVVLKLVGGEDQPPGHMHSVLDLCDHPWRGPNTVMGIGEIAAALNLFVAPRRIIGAVLGLSAMSCAGLFSIYAGLTHVNLAGCGCFGPFDAPWWVHLVVSATVALACALAVPSLRMDSVVGATRTGRG